MQLTGKEIISKGIIKNFIESGIQQQGVDVRIKNVKNVEHGGKVNKDKTYIPEYTDVKPIYGYYTLEPGYYEIELEEGCEIPSNATLHFKTRSSLVRCGSIVNSGQFDAGFKTDNMGCFLLVNKRIEIEVGARIAQALVFTSSDVDNLYDGQWQNDRQRK